MFLHRFLLDSGELHVNRSNDDKLDNRRNNLRACTTANYTHDEKPKEMHHGKPVTCRFKRVFWDRSREKYIAQIRPSDRQMFLGYFADPVQAAHAYDRAAREYFGEFARTNFA